MTRCLTRAQGMCRPWLRRFSTLHHKVWLKHDRTVPLFAEAIAGLERLQGPDDRNLLTAMVGLSGSYLELHHFTETQALLEPAIDRMGRVLGERDQQTQIAFYNLGIARAGLGDVEGAFRYLRESIERGWTYPGGIAHDSLLLNLHHDPRFEALDRAGRLNQRETWEIYSRQAEWRIREGRLDEAERLLRGLIEAIERLDRNGAGGRAVAPRNLLAKCLIRGGRFADAERLLLQTLAAQRTHGTLELLAQCDIAVGRRESAMARIAEASSLEHPVYGNAEVRYAEAQAEALRGRTEEALRQLVHVSELGFDDVDRLEHDLAFKSLRNRTEFAAAVKSARRHEL